MAFTLKLLIYQQFSVLCSIISHRVEKGHSFSTTMLGDPDSDQGKVTDESTH